MLRRQRLEAVPVAVVLNEDVVPDLEDLRFVTSLARDAVDASKDAAPRVGIVHVHQRCGIPTTDAIVVDLRAGPARPDVAHLPKIISSVKR